MAAGWKITRQVQEFMPGPGNVPVEVVTVDYQNDAGTISGTLHVPIEGDAAATFHQMWQERLALHNAIAMP